VQAAQRVVNGAGSQNLNRVNDGDVAVAGQQSRAMRHFVAEPLHVHRLRRQRRQLDEAQRLCCIANARLLRLHLPDSAHEVLGRDRREMQQAVGRGRARLVGAVEAEYGDLEHE